ncbi:MAG: FAD-dependent oxidoreductase [Gemmatimonadota bacterium]|nr:FAD-dependent oxidoreductase [Gemmatimonadota bacterium]
MASVLIVGDGPGGLSAALFLAKNGMDVAVFGQNTTPMHKAMLYNYLGIPELTGSEFQRISRNQVAAQGASIEDVQVAGIEKTRTGFTLTTEDGATRNGQYLILAAGTNVKLGVSIGLERGPDGLECDRDGRTAVDGLYVVGWSTRLRKTQAIISAGQGASAALDILSIEAGEDVHDFDVVS